MLRIKAVLSVAAITVAMSAGAQTTGQKPSFEVASVKANLTGAARSMLGPQPGGRFIATNVPLKVLITNAYQLLNFQVIGGPDWINTDRWDVVAKAEEGSIVPGGDNLSDPAPTQLRLQSLLQDQFKLRTHTETRDLPIYELVVLKEGVRAKLSDDQTPPPKFPVAPSKDGSMVRGNLRMGPANIQARAVALSDVARSLSVLLARPVVDKTSLTELYDIDLKWSPDVGQPMDVFDPTLPYPRNADGPSLFTALQEQLGLRLVSTKGPVEVLVIDSVAKPTVN
jgi:uncharacterized protein (TIGR03435 family)